ncbi:MAG: VWA domain-containing protein, partial [Pseudomonadales bacterium]|nr:VWA domain-containing protein [Pseudomonadales bacterium]
QPDLEPSRLERARLKIADLTELRRGQPLGLMAYAGSAHLVLPPTRDTAIVASMAAEIEPGIMPEPGDRLDLALEQAQRVLAEDARGGSVVVLADAVDTDPALLERVAEELSVALQFLALNVPGSSEDQTLRSAARMLSADVEAFEIEGNDVAAIVRRAARTPDALHGEQGGQWQEAGYWLVLPLALLVLAALCRREIAEPVT